MKLIGSQASPYVRRIRLILKDRDYEFIPVNVFSTEGQALLGNYSKIRRVPILEDQNKVICDSNLIADYLTDIDPSKKQELLLINEMTDSGILLHQFRVFKLDPEWENNLTKNHLMRIDDILAYFDEKPRIAWDEVGQWLYCALDWLEYRKVIDWERNYLNLYDFYQIFAEDEWIKKTDPRELS